MPSTGEVDNPSRTFPRALLWAVLLVVASYFLPTLAALGVTVDSSDWELGYYGRVAQQVCGSGQGFRVHAFRVLDTFLLVQHGREQTQAAAVCSRLQMLAC